MPVDRLKTKAHFVEHHLAHIGSSYYVSPFERAAVLSIDGFGDMVSAMWGVGEGGRVKVLGEVAFPHSLGVYYTAVTQFLGFPKYGDEYKVMGLASYGEPTYLDQFRRIVHSSGLGYDLGLDYFRHHIEGAAMTWDGGSPELPPLWGPGMEDLLGPARRSADEPLEDRHRDIAATLQARLEEVVLGMLRDLHAKTGLSRAVSGRRRRPQLRRERQDLRRDAVHRPLHPAGRLRRRHERGRGVSRAPREARRPALVPHGSRVLGPGVPDGADARRARGRGASVRGTRPPTRSIERTADVLADGGIVGWFQGRVEFGPRALGNRSILADPRRDDMQDILNARIKHREPFRPFAPAILEERTGEWFEKSYPSPFMLLTYPVRPEKRDLIPAPTHVDGTGRLQTVRRDQNERYYDLIRAFEDRTGVPVLLNTSFNENEPICCTPEQAVDTFVRTKMDLLVLGDLVCEKPGTA